MSGLHQPLKAKIAEKIDEANLAAEAGDVNAAIFGLLDMCAALARDVAQSSWLLHYEDEDRDEKMSDVVDDLVFAALQMPLSKIYPELPGQVKSVLLDAFDDEHFRLEDPLGWTEINDDNLEMSEALS